MRLVNLFLCHQLQKIKPLSLSHKVRSPKTWWSGAIARITMEKILKSLWETYHRFWGNRLKFVCDLSSSFKLCEFRRDRKNLFREQNAWNFFFLERFFLGKFREKRWKNFQGFEEKKQWSTLKFQVPQRGRIFLKNWINFWQSSEVSLTSRGKHY